MILAPTVLKSCLVWLFLALFVTACASGHCRRPEAPSPEIAIDEEGLIGKAEDSSTTDVPTSEEQDLKGKRVVVFKSDGSIQCQMASGVSLEAMAKELQGIHIFSQNKQHDGMMRSQVCGNSTGNLNTYTILEKDLEKAQNFGFRSLKQLD